LVSGLPAEEHGHSEDIDRVHADVPVQEVTDDVAVPDEGDVPDGQPVFHGECMVDDWATTGTNGRTARVRIMNADLQIHPMKGLRCGRGRANLQGQRMRMVVSKVMEGESEPQSLYMGDTVLTWWADDCTNGMRFSFRFSDGPENVDWHPLSGMMTGKNGDVVFLTVIAINDAEEVEDPREARRSRVPFSQMSPTQQSQIKCRLDTNFQRWVSEHGAAILIDKGVSDLPEPSRTPQAYAEDFVRLFCGVESRAEMGHDTQQGFMARDAWREIMRLYLDSLD